MYVLTDTFYDDNGEELFSTILGYSENKETLQNFLITILKINKGQREAYKIKYKEYLEEIEKFIIENYDEIVWNGFKNGEVVYGKNRTKENNQLDNSLIEFLKRNPGFIITKKQKPKIDFCCVEKLDEDDFVIRKINEIK